MYLYEKVKLIYNALKDLAKLVKGHILRNTVECFFFSYDNAIKRIKDIKVYFS